MVGIHTTFMRSLSITIRWNTYRVWAVRHVSRAVALFELSVKSFGRFSTSAYWPAASWSSYSVFCSLLDKWSSSFTSRDYWHSRVFRPGVSHQKDLKPWDSSRLRRRYYALGCGKLASSISLKSQLTLSCFELLICYAKKKAISLNFLMCPVVFLKNFVV